MDTADLSPNLPPLFRSERVPDDALISACKMAKDGCDSGTVTWCLGGGKLDAAIVFAPEVPLSKAAQMLPLCGVGLQNALGALAPPEVAIHLAWSGAIHVNGGLCGALTMAAPATASADTPDWLVIGLTLPFLPGPDWGGTTPDHTALYNEGCGDLDPITLLEAWIRHTLVWLNRWSEDGPAALLKDWTGLAHGLNTDITLNGQTGTFLGIDDTFALLLKIGPTSRLIPLATLIQRR